MNVNEVVLKCCKCGCHVHVFSKTSEEIIEDLQSVIESGCPNCGKSSDTNWLLEKAEEVEIGENGIS